ncbi:MAG: Unknown protein [uncultured Sulfurovum sp.]|uniref:Endonuclease GajA/Old nuclease/RecF-like AAA domain-containing protein n=1 Tax=uncultured Sulfurovum sp. TaxID=269237 RepID=A0A6S6TZE4_9BACT|nr:MAG: Unknown protein [uncultured Sulfurovum sp.]
MITRNNRIGSVYSMERLIVKNFGPLKDIDIELNKINLFIGKNGSGKSVLAKLITVLLDLTFQNEKKIFKNLSEYNINYIVDKTIIRVYNNNGLYLEMKSQTFTFKQALIYNEIDKCFEQGLYQGEKLTIAEEECNKLNLIEKEKVFNKIKSRYIPAERNLISLFNKAITNFLLIEDFPLPKFLLQFTSEFEKAGNELKELAFLDVKYVNGDGLDRHKVYFNDEDYLSLEHSSSGIQSALPLYLTVKYFAQKHKSIIIEEPEQNLFPKAQTETIKYIIEQVSSENELFLMTHSPYVLSTLNILMMAHKVGNLSTEVKTKVDALIPESQWLNRDEFSAYYLKDGEARDIKGNTGLISENEIDEVSDEIAYEFDELLELYSEYSDDR